MRRPPRMPRLPDDGPLALDEKEIQAVMAFDLQILAIQRQKALYLREAAKAKGLIAPRLKDLKSESGKPFVEEKLPRFSMGHDFRRAVSKMGTAKDSYVAETAYFCHSMHLKKDPDSCGWVKGRPDEKEYDEISCLAGSAGIRYYCKICGKLIGEHRFTVS